MGLEPMPGLLDETLDQALRTRQRRVLMADNPRLDLQALATADDALDRAVVAAALYGPEADRVLSARIDQLSGRAQEAAVFLRVAVAVQNRHSPLSPCLQPYLSTHRRALHDALWFYPVPGSVLREDSAHLAALFAMPAPDAALLGVELTGRRAAVAHRDTVRSYLRYPQVTEVGHLALARLGRPGKRTRRFLETAVAADDPARQALALEIIIVLGQRLAWADLTSLLTAPTPAQDLAWALAVSQAPRAALDQALADADLPDPLSLRVMALSGYGDGLIAACGHIAAGDGPATPEQRDVLTLMLGDVPAALRVSPSDPAAKAQALRETVLQTLRRHHITLHNDADTAPWTPRTLVREPDRLRRLRLRDGTVMGGGVPPFTPALWSVTHPLRQWLYWERAVTGGRPFALSASDVTRRQRAATMIAELADADTAE